MSEKHGIDVAKKAVVLAARFRNQIATALEDDKISMIEGLGLAATATGASEIVAEKDQLIAEIQDLSDAEISELKDLARAESTFTDEEVEEFVVDALGWTAHTVKLVYSGLALKAARNAGG